MSAGLGLGLSAGVPARAELPPSGLEQTKTAKQIKANLESDPTLANNRIDVRVSGDVVTLTGTVDSEGEKMRAARLADIRGVQVVDNELKVENQNQNQSARAVADSAITSSLKTQFLANGSLSNQDISVDTRNGVVTLRGHVSTEDQHGLAVDMARHTAGVVLVEDNLLVVPLY